MIAGGPPFGGFSVAASHWAGIGNLAAAAIAAKLESPVSVEADLRTKLNEAETAVTRLKARETSLEEYLARANATVEDQAAQIVDLQAKLGLGAGNVGAAAERETIKKLQKIEADLRWEAERSEGRVRQLEDWARAQQLVTPDEPVYYRSNWKQVL